MLRNFLILACALCLSAPAVPETPQSIPADAIARAKFPLDNPDFIDALSALNKAVNHAIQPESDLEHYGVEEMWVMLPADGKGDCEDYALTKIYFLQQAGYPIVTNTKLVGIIVRKGKGSEGHAILAVRLPSGDVAYMDSLNDELMTRPELVGQGYVFSDWKA